VRHFVDISTVHTGSWGPPRGVTRLEYNVAREALLLGAELVRFDEALQGFVPASLPLHFGRAPDPVKILLTGTPTIRPPLLRRRVIRRARALGKFLSREATVSSETDVATARGELAWLLAHNYEFLSVTERFELASLAQALEPHALCHKFNYWVMGERERRALQSSTPPAEGIELRTGDKLLSVGAVWTQNYIESLEQLALRGVSVVALIYDMIPITHPSFLPAEEVERFAMYLERMLRSPIRLTTISRFSQEEIARYCRQEWGISKEVAVTPLASSASTASPVASTKIVDAGLHNAPFVFMAGSFEPRKNQKFLLDIWRSAVARLSEPPALVFAGGLASVAYLQELQQDARDLDRVLFFFNVEDEELAWFYENCLFTVFPSEAEGWGLPITEALDRGKYCLASDNTSLREAGEGLIFHAALQERGAWLEELHKLLRDPHTLEARTKRIRETHRTRTWADVTRAMMAL
jgi:glycosyltransferase involved in cell wall biosynthesis